MSVVLSMTKMLENANENSTEYIIWTVGTGIQIFIDAFDFGFSFVPGISGWRHQPFVQRKQG